MTAKYKTFVPRTFSQDELDQKIKRKQVMHDPKKSFTTHSFADALGQIEALRLEGWVLDQSSVPLAIPLGNMIDFQFVMIKPTKLVKAEQKVIASQVEAEYRAGLEAEQAEALQRMTARLIGEAEDKNLREEQAAQAELETSAREQAAKILGLDKGVQP